MRCALLCSTVGSLLLGCGAAPPPAWVAEANERNAHGEALMSEARAALGIRDVARARALANEVGSLGVAALQGDLQSFRVEIDDVEAVDVPEAAFRKAKAEKECLPAVFEIARHVEAHRGTSLAEKLRMRSEDAVSACLAETVAARVLAGDGDGARGVLADERVKTALGFAWEAVNERMAAVITEAEARRAKEAADAAEALAFKGFKAFVTESMGLVQADAKLATISYGDLVSDMQISAFKKGYPGAQKVPLEDALVEKYSPGRVARFKPGAAECATCGRDSLVFAHAEFTGGRMSEVLLERRGGKGPGGNNVMSRWNDAFQEAVRAALSARFDAVRGVEGTRSAMLAYLVKGTATHVGPVLLVEWLPRDGAVVLKLSLWGDAHSAYETLRERAEAAEERAEEAARKREIAKACAHVRVGKSWSIPYELSSSHFTVVAVHPEKGTATVHSVSLYGTPDDDEYDCKDIE